MLGQKPLRPKIKTLVFKTFSTLKNRDTTEFKKLFSAVPQNMTNAFVLSQLDILAPLSEIINNDIPIYKIEIKDLNEFNYKIPEQKKSTRSYRIDVLFKLSENSYKGLSFIMKRDSNDWLYDGQYDISALSGTHYLNCSRNKNSDTIIDRVTGNKFFLDREHIWITGINSSDKVIWTIRPNSVFDDNPELKYYRTNNPQIDNFFFHRIWRDKMVTEIYITYNNSQCWRLNQDTGVTECLGQD